MYICKWILPAKEKYTKNAVQKERKDLPSQGRSVGEFLELTWQCAREWTREWNTKEENAQKRKRGRDRGKEGGRGSGRGRGRTETQCVRAQISECARVTYKRVLKVFGAFTWSWGGGGAPYVLRAKDIEVRGRRETKRDWRQWGVWHTGDNETLVLSCVWHTRHNETEHTHPTQHTNKATRYPKLHISWSNSIPCDGSGIWSFKGYRLSIPHLRVAFLVCYRLSWCVIVSLYPSESLQGIWSTPPPSALERHIHERNIGPYHTDVTLTWEEHRTCMR